MIAPRKQECELRDKSSVAQVSPQDRKPDKHKDLKAMRGKNRKITLSDVCTMENMREADREARRGKSQKYGVRKFDRHREEKPAGFMSEHQERNFPDDAPNL